MTARSRRSLRIAVALLLGAAFAAGARSGLAGEEDDLQREIDTQRVSVADLERLDELKATTDEIAQLRSWLDEAWNLRSKHEYDQVREVLERTRKQADLIRAKITASKLRAQAAAREASLAEVRARIARTKKALGDTVKKKKSLETKDKGAGPVGDKAGAPAGDNLSAPVSEKTKAPAGDKPMPAGGEKVGGP
jgi:predicted  nucleic acid-binding Zn-ribbon protein